MYYVYRFLDKKENIIYVGKSRQDLEQRFRGHIHLPDACYELTYKIEYIECSTESDMSIKEIYYINKYRHDGDFFNVVDMTGVPVSVEFNDNWQQYKGPLGSHFHHSINYIKGYAATKEVRYNKDGSIDRRKTNKEKGVDAYVEGLTPEEVDLIIEQLIIKINAAENNNQEQIGFRNLVMFVLGINLPLKANEFLSLKYRDLFTENDETKTIELRRGRFHKDEIIQIPLRKVAKEVLLAYTHKCGLTYARNADDDLFQSRKHQVLSVPAWWRIINEAVVSAGIEKSIGAESIRKTYGLNIFEHSADKFEALLFLGELWGQVREAKIIRYLNIADDEMDYEYYFGESFSLGSVDLTQIECLQSQAQFVYPSTKVIPTSQTKQVPLEKKLDPKQGKDAKTNRLWPKEKKLEIVLKHIEQRIPQKDLARQYGVDSAYISRWVCEYKKYGEAIFEDRRFKSKNKRG